MELIPLRLDHQIEDAISGYTPPELAERIRQVTEGTVTYVNGKRAYNVAIEGADILYTVRQASKTRYYYPIQYARIVIAE